MEVFISWAGEVSRRVAESLGSFVQHVVSGSNTFLSSHNIEAGERWEAKLSAQLERQHHALILCLTKENQGAPWLNYEAGAIGAASTQPVAVIPYTIGFPPDEINVGPLSRFQGVRNDEKGTWELIRALSHASEIRKDDTFVREGFETFWPKLRADMAEAMESSPSESWSGPPDRELLLELRRNVQSLLAFATAGGMQTGGAAWEILAETDPLTSLPNLRAFTNRASQLASAGAAYVVALIDLDGFKRINDLHGHHIGDRLLARVAASLTQGLASADMIARYAGDEFVVIFRNVSPETAQRELISVGPLLAHATADEALPQVTISAGVSGDLPELPEEKLREAERAMLTAKEQPGNSVHGPDSR